MKLSEALQIVLELANENIIDDPEYQEEKERQEEAVEIVEKHLEEIR